MANSGGASSGAIKAGGAYVLLFTDSTALEKGLAAAERRVHKFASLTAGAGLKLAGAGAAILAPIGAMAKEFLERGDKFAKASARLGASAEDLSLLDYAARQSGTSFDALERHLLKMQGNLADAADKGGEMADALREVGLSAEELAPKGATDQLLTLADALEKVEDQSHKVALARKIAGKSAPELFPLLAGGAKGVRNLMAEGKLAGSEVSTRQAQAAEKIGDALSRSFEAAKNAAFAFFEPLIPQAEQIESLSMQVLDFFAEVRQWASENQALIVTVVGVGAALVVAGGALLAVGTAGAALGVVLSGIGTFLGIVSAGIGLILSPVGLVIAGVVALGAVLLLVSEDAANAAGAVLNYFGGMADTFKAAWGSISEAIGKGDLRLAFKIAAAGLNVEWTKLIVQLTKAWNSFKNLVVDTWHLATTEIAKGMVDVLDVLRKQFPDAFRQVFGDVLADMDVVETKRAIDLDEKLKQRRRNESRANDLTAANAAHDAAAAEFARLRQVAKDLPEIAPMPREAKAMEDAAASLPKSARAVFGTMGFGNQVFGPESTVGVAIKKTAELTAEANEQRKEQVDTLGAIFGSNKKSENSLEKLAARKIGLGP